MQHVLEYDGRARAAQRIEEIVNHYDPETSDRCKLCGLNVYHDLRCPVPHLKRANRRFIKILKGETNGTDR